MNNDLESCALVAQVRSTALDLLQAAGMGLSEAFRHPRTKRPRPARFTRA